MATTTTTVTEPAATSAPPLKIKQIYTYPIKSIRGLALRSLNATPLGFAHDRRFMLVSTALDPKTGLVTNMHVSKFEEMCLFTTHVPNDSSTAEPTTHIEVRYGKSHCFKDPTKPVDGEPLLVPLQPDTQGLATVKIRMHHSPTLGHDMGAAFNGWFSARFGYEVKLLYLGDNRRKVLGNIAPEVAAKQARGELAQYDGLKNVAEGEEQEGQGAAGWLTGITSAVSRVAGGMLGSSVGGDAGGKDDDEGVNQGIGFADVAPFLIINSKSWENASSRLPAGQDYDITKFRPNIVVEGADEAFDEDFWGELRISGSGKKNSDDAVKIVLTQNCARCNSLNVDFATGKVGEGDDGKILKLLSKDRRVDQGSKWSPIFGRYGFLGGRGEVTFSVGDDVTVSRRNEARTQWEWPGVGTYPKQT